MTHHNLASTVLCAGCIVEKCVAWRPLVSSKTTSHHAVCVVTCLALRASDVVKKTDTSFEHLKLRHAFWSADWQRRVTLNGPYICTGASFTFQFASKTGMWSPTAYSPSGVQQISNRRLSVLAARPAN